MSTSLRERTSGRGPASTPVPPRPSFDRVYHRTFRYVYRMLQRLGVREQDLEDVAHDVLVAVFESLPKYDPRRRLTPWVAAICYRFALRYHKRTQRDPGEPETPPEIIDLGLDPEAQVMRGEVRDLVLALLKEVPIEYRIVLVLHAIDEVPLPEIARALSIAEGTAQSRLRLARRDFRASWRRLKEEQRRALEGSGVHVVALAVEPDTFLALEKYIPDTPDGAEERVWGRLQSRLRGDVHLHLPSTPLRRAFSSAQFAAGIGAAFVVGGGVGALVLWLLLRSPDPPPLPVAEPAPALAISSIRPAPARVDAAAVPSSAPADKADAGPVPAYMYATERSLLQRARDALARGDTAAARAALEQHRRQFPSGSLAHGRDRLWQSLSDAGRGER